MNDQHVKGSFKELKGKAKQEIGHFSGAEKQEASGVADQVIGKVQQKLGDLKDTVKEKVDQLLHSDSRGTKRHE